MIDWLDVADQRRKEAKENPPEWKPHLLVEQDPMFARACFITATCSCGESVKINSHWTEFNRWKVGENIQTVYPLIGPDVREMLISGTCQKCWDRLFSEEEPDHSFPTELLDEDAKGE